jgi:hypothetical protein
MLDIDVAAFFSPDGSWARPDGKTRAVRMVDFPEGVKADAAESAVCGYMAWICASQ